MAPVSHLGLYINIQDKKEGVATFSKECKTNLESRKVKCVASHNKHWAKSTKMQAVYLAGNILRLTRVKETVIQKFSENFLD